MPSNGTGAQGRRQIMTTTTEQLPNYTVGKPADWNLIPRYMIGGLRSYIEDGVPQGRFLTALLSNDLHETFARADEINSRAIREWVKFLHCYAPTDCWGSPVKVRAWCAHRGLNGLKSARDSK
jgi:hypothetical protein